MGDPIACPFLLEGRLGAPHRCRMLTDPETMRPREAPCSVGIGGTCPHGEQRERELSRRGEATKLNERPASIWCRLARKAAGVR